MKRLDTLLRNKLHWHESEVRDAELNTLMQALGVREKRKKVWPFMLTVVVFLCSGVAAGVFLHKYSLKETGSAPIATVSSKKSDDRTLSNKSAQHHTDPDKITLSANGNAQHNKSGHALKPANVLPILTIEETENRPENLPNTTDDFLQAFRIHSLQTIKQAYTFEELNYTYNFALQSVSLSKKPSVWKQLQEVLKPVASCWIAPMISAEKNNDINSESGKVHKDYHSVSEHSFKPLFSVSAGLDFQFRMFPVLSIGSGISYYNLGESYSYDYRINNIPVIDSASSRIVGYLYRHDTLASHVKSKGLIVRTFVEIPLRMRFDVFKYKSATFGIEPAITVQFLKRSSGEYIDRQSLQLRNETSVKSVGANLQMGIPVSFDLSGRYGMSITPFAGRTINNMSLSDTEKKVLFYSGIRLAFNYKLY